MSRRFRCAGLDQSAKVSSIAAIDLFRLTVHWKGMHFKALTAVTMANKVPDTQACKASQEPPCLRYAA